MLGGLGCQHCVVDLCYAGGHGLIGELVGVALESTFAERGPTEFACEELFDSLG